MIDEDTAQNKYFDQVYGLPVNGCADLLAAAKAVIARWETPAWKDAEPTAAVIARLRAAIAEAEMLIFPNQISKG